MKMPIDYLMRLKSDRVAMWLAVGALCVLSAVTTMAARNAGTAATRAEVAVAADERNEEVLDALTKLNRAGTERATEAAQSVVGYIRCLALVPANGEPAQLTRRDLIVLLDDCARQVGLEPGPNPTQSPTTTTTRP